jgi:secondary thiamine-phosphate synthase enzyme
MKSIVIRREVDTKRDTELIDITAVVREAVEGSGVREGVAFITTLHTTTSITINEGLPDVEEDLVAMLERLAPTDSPAYNHARFLPTDGAMAINSACHQRAALLGMQVAFPVEDGRLTLGGRQTIYFVELDGPLRRRYLVHVIGE